MVGGAQPGLGNSVATGTHLRLLGMFGLFANGMYVQTPVVGQRILALLVILGGHAHRSRVAGELWPDQGQPRALSNLRCAVSRMPQAARNILGRSGSSLTLHDSLTVDFDVVSDYTRRLLSSSMNGHASTVNRELLMDDLLPGFDDQWLIVPREQHRQRRLHALETLALNDLECGRALDAVDTALAAVAAEPLRESAQLLLIKAHLAAGNRAAARDQFHRFRDLLATELRVEPSAAMSALIESRVTPAVTLP